MKSIRKFLLLCLSLALGVALLFALNSCGDDHEHDFTYRTTVVNPDCQSGGYTCNYCECGAMKESDYVPPRGHIPEVVPGRPATCFESGLTDGSVCASCGQTLSEQQTISPSHTVVTDEAVEATCKEQGLTEGSHCSVCNTVIVSQYPTSKTGHKFDGDSCEVCGCEYYTEGLAFTYVQETDSYKITGSPLVDEVYIPSTYEGKSVTVIGDGSFRSNSAVKTVHIPDTVTTIEKEAFMFSGLESLLLPATVTSIGEYAFYEGVETVYYGGTVADWCKLTFTVSGENPMMFADSFYFLDNEGDKLYEGNKYSELTALVIPDGITTISNYAFCSLSSLMSVTFSDDVESIGKFAFAECENIHTVNFGAGLKAIGDEAFKRCKRLTELRLPDALESIGYCAFYGCELVANVYFPATLREIGENAFYDFFALENLYYGGTVADLCSIVYGSKHSTPRADNFYILTENGAVEYDGRKFDTLVSVTVPASVTEIHDYAFYGINTITEVELHDAITYIGDYSFYSTQITEISFPAQLLEIGDFALPYSLTCDIILPEGLTTLGEEAISGSYTTVYLPSTLKTVGKNGFAGSNISTVYYGGTLAEWCAVSFTDEYANPMSHRGMNTKVFYMKNTEGDVSFGTNSYSALAGAITIPEGVTKIESGVFVDFDCLTSVTLPSTLKEIGYKAFYRCTELTEIRIPESVDVIGGHAFAYCRKLVSAYMPEEMTSIGSYAFYSCNLQGITVPEGITVIEPCTFEGNRLTIVELPSTLIEIKERAFHNCSSMTSVQIPEGVTKIGWYAFSSCPTLAIVVLPSTLTTVEYDAFKYNNDNIKFCFRGASDKFAGVSIDATNVTLTPDTVYYYSATEPTTAGRYWYTTEQIPVVFWGE